MKHQQNIYIGILPQKLFPSALKNKKTGDRSKPGVTVLEQSIAFTNRQQENHVPNNMIEAQNLLPHIIIS